MKNLDCTPFQRKVYAALLKIPKGQVRTYAQVARMIGKPNAARAVGQALKRNRWAPAIPCHRVIASDGSLGGYSGPGGLAAKRRLLRKEQAA
ncbi:MAG: MGMT family protein [Candidatus Omnitrophota bacterium]|nr:MGMT family protein [Candidatus Omnitrophota bacterium]